MTGTRCRIRRIGFLGTPHLGADLASWAGTLRLIARPSSATRGFPVRPQELRTRSELGRLTASFLRVAISLYFAAGRPHNCGDLYLAFCCCCERYDDGCGKLFLRSTLATRGRRKLSAPSQPSDGHRPDPGVRHMSASSRVRTKGDDGPEVLWKDSERVFCRERRPDADGNLRAAASADPRARSNNAGARGPL